jgi:hypothetical protein
MPKYTYWKRMTQSEIDAEYAAIHRGVEKYGMRFTRPDPASAPPSEPPAPEAKPAQAKTRGEKGRGKAR